MNKSILVTGGVRSGKSLFAERLVKTIGERPIYIATAQALDDEMEQRIVGHQARRGPEWTTIHAPLDLVGALRASEGKSPRLVDCLTLWLTNLILSDKPWRDEIDILITAIRQRTSPVVFVTNEVGMGIVPESKLGREFRDAAGFMNQKIASASDEVYLTVAGIPMKVKPNDDSP